MQLPPVDRSPIWRPQGADLYSTGASGAVAVRPVQAAHPVESTDRLGEGATVRESGKSRLPGEENRDWTLPDTRKEATEKAEEVPKEPPLYQQMIEFIQSMWRASGSAVEVALDVNKTAQQERAAQQVPPPKDDEPLTYADPKVKRTSGL